MIELSIALTVLAIAAWDVGRRYVARDSKLSEFVADIRKDLDWLRDHDLAATRKSVGARLDGLDKRLDVLQHETWPIQLVDRVDGLESRLTQLRHETMPAQLIERVERVEVALTNLAKQAQADLTALKSDMETLRGEAVSAARLAARVGRRK